jgi:glycosyltransferase involved in cell wall biosynthesis
MRILHLSTTLRGGAGIAASRLNEALCGFGTESRIHCLTKETQIAEENVFVINRSSSLRLKSKLVTYAQSKFVSKPNKSLSVVSVDSIDYKEIDFFNPDVINVHSMYNLLNHDSLLKLSNSGYPLVITLHDQRGFTGGCHYSNGCNRFVTACNSCPQATFTGKKLINRIYKDELNAVKSIRNLKVAAPSLWLANLSRKSNILGSFPTVVINNAIPSYTYRRQDDKATKSIGFIASDLNNPLKNLSLLLQALKKIDGHIQNLEVVLIGRGEVDCGLTDVKVSKLEGLTQEQIAKTVSSLHLLVVPSLEDNSPNVIGEALMNGTRVIGASTGGIPELLENDESLLFDPQDIDGLASAITRNLCDYRKADIAVRAEERFSFMAVASKYIELYKSMV